MSYVVDTATPSTKKVPFLFHLLCVMGGSLFLALLSQIEVPLWFTPVPMTLQTLGVLLIGAVLGSKRGALAIVCYLAEGAFGLPVFSGGACGIAHFFGPTAGYLLGFIVCAYLVGSLLEKGWKQSYLKTTIAFILGSAVILAMGAFWLAFFVGAPHALKLGFYPFLLVSGVKVAAASLLVPSGWKIFQSIK